MVLVELNCAGFNKVSYAFIGSVLANEIPPGSIVGFSGIAVRIKFEVTDFPEILSQGRDTGVLAAVLRAPLINCWQYGQSDS